MRVRHFVETRSGAGAPWTRAGCNEQSKLGFHPHASYRAALAHVARLRREGAHARADFRVVTEGL